MNLTTKAFLIFILIFLSFRSFGQSNDTVQAATSLSQDTFHIITENIPRSKLWGNCWQISPSYTKSRSHEFSLNLGRTYGSYFCSGGGCIFKTYGWGMGYGLVTKNHQTNHLISTYVEHTLFYFPPISYGLRMEHLLDLSTKSNYIRPSIGLSFIRLDLLYNYSIMLNGNENLFKHGISLRYKIFRKQDNWQYTHPDRC